MKNPSEILVKQATVVDPNSPFHKESRYFNFKRYYLKYHPK